MPKYNVGDKVTVRSDLVNDEIYEMYEGGYSDAFVSEMSKFAGQEVTISQVVNNGGGVHYFIEEDKWHWVDEMFVDQDNQSLNGQ